MSAQTIPIREPFPSPPADVCEAGAAAWETGRQLWIEGKINDRNLGLWKIYCEQFDRIANYKADLEEDGDFQITEKGAFIPHPALKEIEKAERVLIDLAVKFGLIVKEKSSGNGSTAAGKVKQFGVSQRKR